MIYADFSYYKDTYCGEMAEGDFKRLSRQASAYLDSVTFDRIPSVTDEKIMEKVKDACCAVTDVLLQKEQRDGIASETNDGISVTYTTEGSTDEQRLYQAAVLYLGQYGAVVSGGGVMLACTETITHIRLCYDRKTDTDAYICTAIHGVSWFGKLIATPENKGLTGAAKITVRIPEDAMPDITIRNGDFIVRGAVDAIEKQADLNGLEYFTVFSVGDNRRSRRKDLRHWAVSGA